MCIYLYICVHIWICVYTFKSTQDDVNASIILKRTPRVQKLAQGESKVTEFLNRGA